ncbi:MAG: hypothetical protein QM665_11665, partial [Desulfovibrio sp.]
MSALSLCQPDTDASSAPCQPVSLEVLDLGRIEYGEALNFQKHRVASRVSDTVDDTLLLLEHDPVITMGRGGTAAHLHVTEEQLQRQGVGLYWVERGGMATFHG